MNKGYYYTMPSRQDLGIPDFDLCTPSQRLHYYSNKKLKETATNMSISDSACLNRRELIYLISLIYDYKIKGQFKRMEDEWGQKVYYNVIGNEVIHF